jgi:hypothetical protein
MINIPATIIGIIDRARAIDGMEYSFWIEIDGITYLISLNDGVDDIGRRVPRV